MEIHVINVVWGQVYIRTFLELSLPTQFAPGNLTSLSPKIKARYIIYTTHDGKRLITQASIFKALDQIAIVEFRLIKGEANECSFDTFMECHSHAIKVANKTHSPIILLSPDSILSSGVFVYLEKAIRQGKRIVAISSARMSLEKYREIVEKKQGKHPHHLFNWSSRDLAVTVIHNLHHRTRCLFLKDNCISTHPSHIYWELDSNNVYGRAFHLHPLLIWPKNCNALPDTSTDGKHFLEKACPGYQTWDVITHCKEIALFEISSDQQFVTDFKQKIDPACFNQWRLMNTSSSHLFFAKHQIILGDGLEKPAWKNIIENANKEFANLGKINSPFHLIRCYFKLIFLVLTGRKKLTFKKVYHHFRFLIVYRQFPSHSLPAKTPTMQCANLGKARRKTSNPFPYFVESLSRLAGSYFKLISLVLIGRKKLNFKKVCHHFHFLITHKQFPYHTLSIRESDQKTPTMQCANLGKIDSLSHLAGCYFKLISLVFTGRKKLSFKKVYHHFHFLITRKQFPYHTLAIKESDHTLP